MARENTYNYYECPNCSEDVPVAMPVGSKYATCPGCNKIWEVNVDAEFENGMWHDLTHLCELTDEQQHMVRMIEHGTK